VALELADAASALPPQVTDELFERARKHFSEAEIVELAAVIAFENFQSRFNRIFDVQSNGLYCPIPPAVNER
jgi:alkylhydroperoxidase family enzyme